jgi:cell division protein FtsQ
MKRTRQKRARKTAGSPTETASRGRASSRRRMPFAGLFDRLGLYRLSRFLNRFSGPLMRARRGIGVTATVVLILASAGYGAVRGGHVPVVLDALADARDALANALGFRITSIALAGQKQITREEILTIAGVTGRTSLLFVDADAARDRLKANPWIADASVLKLYPGRLRIEITERKPFALWQDNRQVSVIASDGTVLEPYVARRFTGLPLVVGHGADARAQEVMSLLDQYPSIRDAMRAAWLPTGAGTCGSRAASTSSCRKKTPRMRSRRWSRWIRTRKSSRATSPPSICASPTA